MYITADTIAQYHYSNLYEFSGFISTNSKPTDHSERDRSILCITYPLSDYIQFYKERK